MGKGKRETRGGWQRVEGEAEQSRRRGDDTLHGTARGTIFSATGATTPPSTGKGRWDGPWGGSDSEAAYGRGTNDALQEGDSDTLSCGPGDDELRGGEGVDVLTGGDNDDRLYDRDGNTAERDEFNCDLGNDTVRADFTERVFNSC